MQTNSRFTQSKDLDKSQRLWVVADNIRSAYNIGSLFRVCDGAGVENLLLCGISPHPPLSKLIKTALGSHLRVSWQYHQDTIDALDLALANNFTLVGLESGLETKNLFQSELSGPVCLVLGNEVSGLTDETVAKCHMICTIPMVGSKSSLNVATAGAIAIYEAFRQMRY